MDNLEYLFAALAVTWLGLFGYLYYLGQRVRELRRDLRIVETERRGSDAADRQ